MRDQGHKASSIENEARDSILLMGVYYDIELFMLVTAVEVGILF